MKRAIFTLALMLLAGAALAHGQCDALRATGIRLLPKATFEVGYTGSLVGCFAGYLPEGMSLDKGLYRFGVFRDGALAIPFSVVEEGMDLSSNPYQSLKIVAVSFIDLDGDSLRDVTVIGQRMIANGERTFVQAYWGCGEQFVYDEKTNADINWDVANKPVVNVKVVQQYIRTKGLKAACESGQR